jgi:hypothetical protein
MAREMKKKKLGSSDLEVCALAPRMAASAAALAAATPARHPVSHRGPRNIVHTGAHCVPGHHDFWRTVR